MEGVHLAALDSRTYTVAWSPATDNVGVVRYLVDINGDRQVVTGTTFTNSIPVPATDLYIQVRAEDAAGNSGRWSAQLIIELVDPTPDPDVSPPSASDSPNDRVDQQTPN